MADDPYLLLVERLLLAYDSVCKELVNVNTTIRAELALVRETLRIEIATIREELSKSREEAKQLREALALVREQLLGLLQGLQGMKAVGDKASTALQTVADSEIARLRVEELALQERKDERELARSAEIHAREEDAKRGDRWFSTMRDAFTHPAVVSVLTILSWWLATRLGVPLPPTHDP